MAEEFSCTICGDRHDTLSRDWGYGLPDEIWALPEEERDAQTRYNDDLCQWGERFFIRCILPVPLKGTNDYFGWGPWVEVDAEVFERYLDLYDADGREEPPVAGKLANKLEAYTNTSLGTRVLIQFQDPGERPTLTLPESDNSRLALEQREGIDAARHHEILEICEG